MFYTVEWLTKYVAAVVFYTLNLVPCCVLFTHYGQVTHLSVGNLAIICAGNGLSPGRRQAIILANAAILLFGPLIINLSEILI